MALVGLILLVGSTFTAVAAPILAPAPPRATVSGALAQPEWVMAFPDGYYLSKNIVVVKDPGFGSPASVQSWNLQASPSTLSSLQLSYNPTVSVDTVTPGSLQMVYTGASPGSVLLSRTFQFPYHGPPKKFIATISFLLSGADAKTPVGVRVFINRIGSGAFNLFDGNQTYPGIWQPPTAFDSTTDSVRSSTLGVTNTVLSPAAAIFSSLQSYSFGVEVTFYGSQQKINIDNFQLSLFGTAYGLLGTDDAGHDVLSQTIFGSQVSLYVGFLATIIGVGLGLVIGLLAGFLGRLVDEVLMRFTDMMLTIPLLPLLIVLVAVLGQKLINVIIILGFLGWMGFARIIRSQVLSIRERPFIEAAKAAGAGPFRIISRHVFPNIIGLTYVSLALAVPAAILSEAALAFLGLSDPSVVSWGNMFEEAELSGVVAVQPPAWWWLLPPGIGIALVSLSFVLIGYSLDEIFNPKLRRRR